jgi:hypothetical protein
MTVELHTDFGKYRVDYVPGMTVTGMVQAVLDRNKFEYRGGFAVQETKTGTVLDPAALVDDGRYYYLTTFLLRKKRRFGFF